MSGLTLIIFGILLLGLLGLLLISMRQVNRLKEELIHPVEASTVSPPETEQFLDNQFIHTDLDVPQTVDMFSEFDSLPIDHNDPKWHTAAEKEENLFEISIQKVIQVSDGDSSQIDPNHFEVFHADRNQTLDIIVSKHKIRDALQKTGGQ